MRRSILVAAAFVAFSAGVLLVGPSTFAEAPATQPAKKVYHPADHVTGDYAKLTLTPEQEAKILAIQQESKKKVRVIEEGAEDAIELLLDEKQKKQLDDFDKEARAKQKARNAQKRAEEKTEKADKKKTETTPPASATPAPAKDAK